MTRSDLPPDETTKDVWPAVCPSERIAVMPGAASFAQSKRRTSFATGAKTRG